MPSGVAAALGAVACLCLFAAPAHAAPHAQIVSGPAAQTAESTASFAFVATETVLFAHFECRLDGGAWQRCASPARYERLAAGPHSFAVRLLGVGADPQPAEAAWTILAAAGVTPPPLAPPPRKPAARAPAQGCADADAHPSAVTRGRLAKALTCLLARERARRRLPGLRPNTKLRRAATGHAYSMLRHRFFGHGSSVGRRARTSGYARGARHWEVGEALHWGEGGRATPRRALREMLASPRHRAILLSPRLRDLGVAVVTYTRAGSGRLAATYVVNLGRRS